MKTDVNFLEYLWPMRHYLVTCGETYFNSNIISVSFCMPVSKEPPLIAIAVGKHSWSRTLIKKTGEFIVNVPPKELRKEIYFCGYNSGQYVNKFRETGLTPLAARTVKAAVIGECFAHMECRLYKEVETGDKILFVGKVMEAYADELLTPKEWSEHAVGDFPEKVYGTRFRKSAF